MTNDQVKSLRRVLDHLKEEETHFESCQPNEKYEHIFKDILVLRDFYKRVNRHNNRLSARIKALRNACKLAYSHLEKCHDTGAKSARIGGRAMKAIENVLDHSPVQNV